MTHNESKERLRDKIVKEIYEILEKERDLLEQKLTDLDSDESPLEDSKEDIDATVQHIAEASVQKTIDSNIEKQLRDIKNALDRIEAGIYGVCKYCDQEITEARLRARPTSTSCVACKKTLTDES